MLTDTQQTSRVARIAIVDASLHFWAEPFKGFRGTSGFV